MQQINITAVPSQTVEVTLDGQDCTIVLQQKEQGLLLDLTVGGVKITSGQVCRDRVLLVRHAYHGFSGDLAFINLQGSSDPEYSGLTSRYVLVYIEAALL